jgi:hypothetical protein
MAEYGIPYMGSKGSICNELIKIFPKAENFYDLFGGGFSVTHAVLANRKNHYQSFHFNEIRPGICDLIKKSINGDFNYDKFKPPFVSREEFFDKLESDPMIKMLWSFGNNGSNYLFSKEIEPYKKSMHNAIVFNQFDDLAKQTLGMEKFRDEYSINEKRLFLRAKIETFRKTNVPEILWPYLKEKDLDIIKQKDKPDHLKQLERLEQLERLQQLEQLERLEQLEQLEFYSGSYDAVPIKSNSVIYCDPPYAGTADYGNAFNTKKFLDWASAQTEPVYISEYDIADVRFKCVFKISKRSKLGGAKSKKIEKVYANQAGVKALFNKIK